MVVGNCYPTAGSVFSLTPFACTLAELPLDKSL
jgi:hypothetical protein